MLFMLSLSLIALYVLYDINAIFVPCGCGYQGCAHLFAKGSAYTRCIEMRFLSYPIADELRIRLFEEQTTNKKWDILAWNTFPR